MCNNYKMKIEKNYNVSKLNTFGISANAKFFVEIANETDLRELFSAPEFKNSKRLFLGGGSNVLFIQDFDGLVILNKLKGISIVKEDSDNVFIKCMGGEIWHDLVLFAVGHTYWGIENLALIPGTVGAAPMQNIGAYGVELKHVLENVEAFDITTGKKRVFTKEECELGYRDSVFKNSLKDKYFISAITLKLSKKEKRNIGYKDLSEYVSKNKIQVQSSKDISDAVSDIRRNKLPDPKVIGNAGSFFKNVFVDTRTLKQLQKTYPDIPHFDQFSNDVSVAGREGVIKIPAAWFVEQCGWKGKRMGNVGVHDKQALVLVNHGGAKGQELLDLAQKIIVDVKEKFDIELVPEVNLI